MLLDDALMTISALTNVIPVASLNVEETQVDYVRYA
jgi:hypothetical protein